MIIHSKQNNFVINNYFFHFQASRRKSSKSDIKEKEVLVSSEVKENDVKSPSLSSKKKEKETITKLQEVFIIYIQSYLMKNFCLNENFLYLFSFRK